MTTNAAETLTIRELRALLFDLDNQQMTIEELRHLLFDLDNNNETAEAGINHINRAERLARYLATNNEK